MSKTKEKGDKKVFKRQMMNRSIAFLLSVLLIVMMLPINTVFASSNTNEPQLNNIEEPADPADSQTTPPEAVTGDSQIVVPDAVSGPQITASTNIAVFGEGIRVKSSKKGTLYMVPKADMPYATVNDLDNLSDAVKVNCEADIETIIPATGLSSGTYQVYAADESGNVSAPTGDIEYAGGEGSEADPYQIPDKAVLKYFAQKVNAGNTYNGKYFMQTNDIDLSNEEWTPIGYFMGSGGGNGNYAAGGFQGVYDGGDHIISNLKVATVTKTGSTGTRHPAGLFGMTKSGCRIKNLHLVNVDVSTTAANNNYLGALIGEGCCTVLNCSAVDGKGICVNSQTGGCGGLIGQTWTNSYVVNCYTNLITSCPNGGAGGLIGCIGDNTIVTNCYARGSIICHDVNSGGGIANWNFANVSNCYSTGTVNGVKSPLCHNTSIGSFNVILNSTYYLSDNDGEKIDGYGGVGTLDSEMKSDGFVKTLNINRSCVTGLMPSDIILYNWKIEGDKNDGYPILVAPDAKDVTIGVGANASAKYSGGSGTDSDPYMISTDSDLVQFAVNVNSGTINTTGQYYKLTNTIDLKGGVWTPIGLNTGTAFNGNFNFNGNNVTGYTVSNTTGVETNYGGLFGVTGSNASIAGYAAASVYTVTYNKNGSTEGSIPVDSCTYTPGETVTVSGNTGMLAKTGYIFAGWNTDAKGNGTPYAAGAKFTIDNKNVTLYAQWDAVPENNAPVLNNASISFTAIGEDDVNNPGTTVADLLSGNVGDANGDTLGIAVISTDTTNGTWWYYNEKNYGNVWYPIPKYEPGLSEKAAVLLTSDTTIRFQPSSNFNGTSSITFRVWDETSGKLEDRVDVSQNGGSTPYSSKAGTAVITVNSINDAPKILKTTGSNILQFDGSNDYLSVPDMHLDGSFTVEAWVKDEGTTGWCPRIFDFAAGADNANQILMFDGGTKNLVFNRWPLGVDYTKVKRIVSPDGLPQNKWVYVTVVYDGATGMGYMYWNGVLKTSGQLNLPNGSTVRNSNFFGHSNYSNDGYFKGAMRGIAVWNNARTQCQIQDDMNTAFGSNEPNLVLYYPMNDGMNKATISSIAGSSYDGTLVNGLKLANISDFDYQITGFSRSDIAVDKIMLQDADSGGNDISLSLSSSHGNITFGSTSGIDFIEKGNGQPSMTVRGTLNELNAAIKTIKYHPSGGYVGADTIALKVSDLGNSGTGGVLEKSETVYINILPSNDTSSYMDVVGKITEQDTGNIIANADIKLCDLSGKLISETASNAQGRYTFSDVFKGQYKIIVSSPEYSSRSFDINVLPVEFGDTAYVADVKLAGLIIKITADPPAIVGDGVKTTTLTAVVRDKNNQPISGVNLTFTADSGSFSGNNTEVTDQTGKCSVVFKSDTLTGTVSKVVTVKAVADDVTRNLHAESQILVTFEPSSIQGIVVDNAGEPIEGARVIVSKDFNDDGIVDFYSEAVTGSNGVYKIAIPKGNINYNVKIIKPVEIGGSLKPVTFDQTCSAGTITGTGAETFRSDNTASGIIVVKKDGAAAASLDDYSGYGIGVYDKNSLYDSEGNIQLGNPVPGVTSNLSNSQESKGVFQSKGLDAGREYTLVVTYDLGGGEKIVVGTKDVKVTDDGQVSISTVLIDPYGTIKDASSGQVIPGANVGLWYADTTRNRNAGIIPGTKVILPAVPNFPPANNGNPQVSDVHGQYAFMVFPDTDYYVTVNKSGYELYTSPTISVGQQIVKFDVNLTAQSKPGNGSSSKPSEVKTGGNIIDNGKRIYGQTRIETALAIANKMYGQKLHSAVIATGSNFPDALSGSVLAYKLDAPILLTGNNVSESQETLQYIYNGLDKGGRIYILGGDGAVNRDIEQALIDKGYTNIKRLGGADRYETSGMTADELNIAEGTPVIITTGEDFPDALSASSIGSAKQYPILLTARYNISEKVKQNIAKVKPSKIYIIGGKGVIDDAVADALKDISGLDTGNIVRISGIDKYETSAAVAGYFNPSGKMVTISTGSDFPDALTGSIYTAKNNALILLADRNNTKYAREYIQKNKINDIVVFGGIGAVGNDVLDELVKR